MNNKKQKLLIEYLCSSSDVFSMINSIIEPEYFDPEYSNILSFVKGHYDEYRTLPKAEQIEAETGFPVAIKDEVGPKDREYAVDQIEAFCKQSAIKKAVMQAPRLLADGNYGEIETMIKDAITVGVNRNIGMSYFDNPKERLHQLLEQYHPLSTGWFDVDNNLNGGINRQELVLFMANSGVGKSIVMSNLGVNLVYQGYNVVYITLELSEHVVTKRFDSMFTGIPQDKIFKSIDSIDATLRNNADDLGTLFVKRMPESITNANMIRAYLKEYELITGSSPDVLIVDYLDLLASNNKISVENLFVKDKFVAEELRAICRDFNCAGVSASQMGRAALDSQEHHQGHIQGGISKVNTADNLIAIIQTEAMKSGGEYMFKYAKTRNSNGVGKCTSLKWDPVSLRVLNSGAQFEAIGKLTPSQQKKLEQYEDQFEGSEFKQKPTPLVENDPLDDLMNKFNL